MTASTMTKAERADLGRVVRKQAKVARNDIEARRAARLAAFEEELATEHAFDAEAWRHVTEEAARLVKVLDGELADICEARGIRPEFRPSLVLGYYERGENADRKRRAELRKVAERRSDADARAAKLEVDRWEAKAETELVALGLGTDEARRFLETIPTAEELLPRLTVAEVELALPSGDGR